jgi:hypothetical protein
MLRLFAFALVAPLVSGCTLYFDDDSAEAPPDARDYPPERPPTNGFQSMRVFVTSATYQGGALGGLVGADAICMMHARAANLPGTYRAWLSAGNASPSTRMLRTAGDYHLVGGEVIAHGWTDLVDGALAHAIDHDEFGAVHEAEPSCMAMVAAWTNTNSDGTGFGMPPAHPEYSCHGWTDMDDNGLLGNTAQTTSNWTNGGCATFCTMRAALYCFED